MTTKQAPIKPEPLSIYVLHSPEERTRHRIEVQAYNDYIREEENRKRIIEQAKIAEANKVLDADEYFQLALKRKAEQETRDAAREAERQAVADAKVAYLASSPAVAEIAENNPHTFLTTVIHWVSRGYSMPEQAEITFIAPSYYAAKLKAPEPAPAKKAK